MPESTQSKTFISDLRPSRAATIEATEVLLEPVREIARREGEGPGQSTQGGRPGDWVVPLGRPRRTRFGGRPSPDCRWLGEGVPRAAADLARSNGEAQEAVTAVQDRRMNGFTMWIAPARGREDAERKLFWRWGRNDTAGTVQVRDISAVLRCY